MQSTKNACREQATTTSPGMCIEILDLGGMPVDALAFMEAIQKDGLADWRRFQSSPGLTSFRRAVTEAERLAYGLPGNAYAKVSWDGDVIATEHFA